MRFAEALGQLDARQPEHMPAPSLDRIREVAALLDDPQLTYPAIHVTGTNGKTTTARVATAVACAHGVTAGLYTSPHLLSVTERLSACGVDITEEEFAEEWEHLAPFLDVVDAGPHGAVTYFEAVTALSFLWFADKPVALGVFEVGMGGTWDATNLVTGDVAVICEVSLDHPELGSTIAEVASEKAGIVKQGKVAVVREQPDEAASVIEARAASVGAGLKTEHRDWEVTERLRAVGGQSFAVRGSRGEYDDLFLPLFGEYAVRNAAAGLVAVELLLDRALEETSVREALATVRSPGRIEVIERSPLLILDGAHNPAGAEALAGAMREFFTWERLLLVLAVSANKDLDGMLGSLMPLADACFGARNDSVRSADPLPIAEAFSAADKPVQVFDSVAAAIEAARAAADPRDAILVTGSLFTIADAKRALRRR